MYNFIGLKNTYKRGVIMGLLFEGLAANDHINIAVLDELAKAEVVVVYFV